jgi:hypothetical protein
MKGCVFISHTFPNSKYEASLVNKNIFRTGAKILNCLLKISRNVTLNVLSRATVGYLLFFALEQLAGSLQRRKMRIYDSTCKTLNTLVYSCEKTDQHKL